MTKPTDAQLQAVSTLASNFTTADSDGNGVLSQEELQAIAQKSDASPELKQAAAALADPANKSAFDSVDSANAGQQDGLIGQEDMRQWLAAESNQFDPAKNPLDENTAAFIAARYFNTWDGSANKDNDGLIDRGEMTAVAADTNVPNDQRYAAQYLLDHKDTFAKLDTRNGEDKADDKIGDDDIKTVFGEQHWDDAQSHTEAPVGSQYDDTTSTPSANTLPLSEKNRALFDFAQQIEKEGGKLDANGDGQLDRKESQGKEALFDSLAKADGTPDDGAIKLEGASATLLTTAALNNQAAASGASEQDKKEASAFSQSAAGGLTKIRDEATKSIDAQLAKIQTTGDLDTPSALSGAMQLVLEKWRPESSGDTIFQALDTVESGLDNADRAQFDKALEHLRWAFEHNDVDAAALQQAVITRNTTQAMLDNLGKADGVRDILTSTDAPGATDKADQLSRAYLKDQVTTYGAPLSSDYVLAGMVASGQIKDPAKLTDTDLANSKALAWRLAEDGKTRDPALEKAAEYMKAFDPQLKDKPTDEIEGKDLHPRLRWEMGLEQADAVKPTNYDYMSFLSGGDDATDAQLFYYNSVANQLKADHPDLARDKYTTESTTPTYSFSAVTREAGDGENIGGEQDLQLGKDDIDFLNQYTADNQLDLSNGGQVEQLQNAWRDHRYPPGSDEAYLHEWVDLKVSKSQNPSVGQADNLSVLAEAAKQANRTFDENGRPLVMDPYAMAAQMAARTGLSVNDEGIPSVTTKDTAASDSQAIKDHVLIAGRNKKDNQLWDMSTLLSESSKALEGMAREVEGVDQNQKLNTAGQIALGIASPIASLVINIFSKPHFNEKQQWVHDQLEANQKSTDALDDALGKAKSAHNKSLLIEGVTLAAATVATVVVPGAAAALRSGLIAGKRGTELAADIAKGFTKGAAIAAGDLASPVATLGGAAGKAAFKNISEKLGDDVAEAVTTSERRAQSDIPNSSANALDAGTPTPDVMPGKSPVALSETQLSGVQWGEDPFYPNLGRTTIDGKAFYVAKTVDGRQIIGQPKAGGVFAATDLNGGFIGNYYTDSASGLYFRGGLRGGMDGDGAAAAASSATRPTDQSGPPPEIDSGWKLDESPQIPEHGGLFKVTTDGVNKDAIAVGNDKVKVKVEVGTYDPDTKTFSAEIPPKGEVEGRVVRNYKLIDGVFERHIENPPAKPSITKISPDELRYSQASVISRNIKGADKEDPFNFIDLIYGFMRGDGTAQGDNYFTIDAVRMPDGSPTSIDNTRLTAANLYLKMFPDDAKKIKVREHSFDEAISPKQRARYRLPNSTGDVLPPATWGEIITRRIDTQQMDWQTNSHRYGAEAVDPPKIVVRNTEHNNSDDIVSRLNSWLESSAFWKTLNAKDVQFSNAMNQYKTDFSVKPDGTTPAGSYLEKIRKALHGLDEKTLEGIQFRPPETA